MRNVTETHCICRSCFTHDTAAQCPTLPKWYHLMKSGHAQQERNAHACCVVCAKLKDQTNSSNSEPTRTCSAKDVSHMAYFFKMAYDADSELLSDGTEHLCSTHFQHYQKRLLSKGKNADVLVKNDTGSPWIGTAYRKCVCCSSAAATEWHLAGQYGEDTKITLDKWLQGNNGAYSDVNSLTYQCIDPSTDGLEDEAVARAELTGHVPLLGCCEWVCSCCWENAVPAKHLQAADPQGQQSGAGLPEIQQLQQGAQQLLAAPQQQQQGQTQVAATSLQEEEPAQRTVATAIALLKTSMSEPEAELTKVSNALAAAADMVEGDDMDAGSADAEALCALLASRQL